MAYDYFQAMDHAGLVRDHPIGADFPRAFAQLSRDELRARQEAALSPRPRLRLAGAVLPAALAAAGIEPGDIGGLDDLARLPAYDKSDLMASVAAHPPIGDFHGRDAHPPGQRPPIIMQTTSGTTGTPQPLLFGPRVAGGRRTGCSRACTCWPA